MTVDEILREVEAFGPEAIDALFGGLLPKLALVPLESLPRIGAEIARLITAKTELAAMQASVAAIDTADRAGEAELLNATK